MSEDIQDYLSLIDEIDTLQAENEVLKERVKELEDAISDIERISRSI